MKKKENVQSKKMTLARNFKKNCWLYIFVLPAILWYVIFQYIPMGGIVIAFKRYNGVLSIWDSPWVGLRVFLILIVLPQLLKIQLFYLFIP